jgi:hypothetical protein
MINVAEELIDFNFDNLLYKDEDDFFDIEQFKKQNLDSIEDDFKSLNTQSKINYITNRFFSSKDFNQDIIDTLKYDMEFKTQLLSHIHTRMQKVINDSSVLYFKEIITIIALLSLGNKYTIFHDYSDFDESLIEQLFRDYESFLIQLQQENQENFELTFKYYITLLEAFNEICIINATDIRRKRTIKNIIDLLTQSINLLKFQIMLDDDKISILNNIQGKFLLYYTHVPFFKLENKTNQLLAKQFQLNLEKQCDGYFLIQSSFEDTNDNKLDNFKFTLLTNATFLILTLLKKFEQSNSIEDINLLDPLIEILNKECFTPIQIDIQNHKQLKNDLLNLFAYTYSKKSDFTYTNLLEYINTTDDINIKNLEILQNIIVFADDIDEQLLLGILSKILNTPKYNNDYHEYFKLKIIDTISLKFIYKSNNEDFIPIINSILNYTQKYNTASHLMELFAKFYLNAALYYCKLPEKYIDKVQEVYYIYEQITGKYAFANEYQSIIGQILENHGLQYIQKLSINDKLNQDNLTDIAISMIYANNPSYNELKYRSKINNQINTIMKNQLSSKIDKKTLHDTICDCFNHNIFFGLATIDIVGLNINESYNLDQGYETITNELFGNYKIIYRYPYAYKKSFMDIYESNKDFIQTSITNLIYLYIK